MNGFYQSSQIVRIQSDAAHYVPLRHAVYRDYELQLEDWGMLGWLMSHGPDWKCSIRQMAKILPHGIDRIRKVLERLEAAGYICWDGEFASGMPAPALLVTDARGYFTDHEGGWSENPITWRGGGRKIRSRGGRKIRSQKTRKPRL